MNPFPILFSPISIGRMVVRNRIVMPALTTGYAFGEVTDQLKHYFEARAKGGAGLIVVGIAAVEKGTEYVISASDDSYIPGLRELAETIHAHGAKTALQLWHPGRYEFVEITGREPVSASDVPPPIFSRVKPRALTVPEIKRIEEEFAQAAGRAKEAGFDAVEFIGSAGYLISQFLSPVTNRRTDEYGGSLENRMRFLLEIVELTKEVVGKDFPLMCRLSGDELIPGGNTLSEMKIVARKLAEVGISAINVTAGWHESRVPMITMEVPRGGYVYLAEGIKEALKGTEVRVAASNRINEPFLAERILREGKADLISMGRALVADPEFPRKAQEGRVEDIVTCVACCQGCFDRLFEGRPLTCMVNPGVGREAEVKVEPAVKKKRVLVVGGGPGGLKVAEMAALRGHQVILCEEDGELGGQLNLASVTPGREELGTVVRELALHAKKAGVEIRLRTKVDADMVEEIEPDAVVLATGALPIVPSFPGVDLPHVVQAWEVLKGREVGKRVVVVGGGGVGCYTAHYLSSRGREVTLLEMLEKVAGDVGITTRWILRENLKKGGVRIFTSTKVKEIRPEGVVATRGEVEEVFPADSVVLAVGSRPNSGLVEELRDKVEELYLVGDCLQPRKALDAIHEGWEVGLKL
ncbi:MAG: FAD-dependent oxidoreductase [Candidatus Hadarchaeales archaeon]